MKRLLLLILPVAALLFAHPVFAQDTVSAVTVSACGTPNNTPIVGRAYPVTQDPTGVLCTSATGGGGGGAVTIANGADVTQGAIADAAWSGTGNGTAIAIAKSIRGLLAGTLTVGTHAVTQSGTWNIGTVTTLTGITNPVAVTGTFWQATQPISGTVTANLGTLNGAATAVLQGAQGTGATYNPPTGGSGEIGYLSGIYAAAIDTTPVSVVGTGATSTNGSTTVTTGGTFQAALASSGTRKGCTIQNPTTASEVLYVFFGTTGSATTANSFSLAAGASISCASGNYILTDNIAVTGATTGHAFVVNSQ